jgi:hypothetical protein
LVNFDRPLIKFAYKASLLLQRNNFFSWQAAHEPHSLRRVGAGALRTTASCHPMRIKKEATMELTMRLNVLAALLSFGFIAAIVFGVF